MGAHKKPPRPIRSIVSYRRMGHGLGLALTQILTHTVFHRKGNKNARFLAKSGAFCIVLTKKMRRTKALQKGEVDKFLPKFVDFAGGDYRTRS